MKLQPCRHSVIKSMRSSLHPGDPPIIRDHPLTAQVTRRFILLYLRLIHVRNRVMIREGISIYGSFDPEPSSVPIAASHESPGQDDLQRPVEGGENLWYRCGHLLALEANGKAFDRHLCARTVASMERILYQHGGPQNCIVCNSMKDFSFSEELYESRLDNRFMNATHSEKEMALKNHMPPPEPSEHLWSAQYHIEKVDLILEKRAHWAAIRLQEFRRDKENLRVESRRPFQSTGPHVQDLSGDYQLVSEGADDQSLSASLALAGLERSSEPAPEAALRKVYKKHAKDVCVIVPFKNSKRGYAREVTEHVDAELIKLWLSRCEKSHSLCSQRNKETNPPGMILIDVMEMRLVQVAMHNPVRYITLSYVWGDISQPTLTKAVLGTWTSDGQLRYIGIPQIIRDAMKLVQMIGYRYIWVDALCIVQDDAASRHGQISQMHEIYRHADMTIVATDGHKCSEGLPGITFAKQRLHKHCRYELPGLTFMKIPSSTKLSIESSPWRTRGWTFQEELCSLRTLVLLPEVMFFSCASAVWREDLQLEGEDALPRSNEGLMSLASMLHGKSTGSTEDLLLIFRDLVKKYMQRTLSRTDDMENAFAGVAGILEPFIGPAYHGIPERMFAEVIRGCWFWDTSLRRREGFPSWSWTGWIYRWEQADVGIQPLTIASNMSKLLAFYKLGHPGIELLGPLGLAAYSGGDFLPWMDVGLRNHFIPDESDMRSKNGSLQHQEGVSSGLIAFYTSIAYLRLRTPPGGFAGTSREYRVFHPQMNRQLTSIRLNVDYVAQKGTLLPFIVIDHDPDKRSFRLMLVSMEGNTVERVNVTSQGRLVKEDDWKDANPKRELVFMS